MKALLISTIFALSSMALAGSLPRSLGETMKAMAANLKAISTQVNDASKNASSASLADELSDLTLNSKNFSVPAIEHMPADQQAAAKADFNAQIDAAAKIAKDLATAFRANDNAKAAQLLKALATARNGGHEKFREE